MRSRLLIRLTQNMVLCLAVSATAFAQYGGGMGGAGAGTGTYKPPKGGYSSGKAIGIGAGVAAAVAGIALFVHHRHNASPTEASLVGCTQSAQNGISVKDEKDNKSYSLVEGSTDLKPGERVELRGKKTKDGQGNSTFVVQDFVGDYGTCGVGSALNAPSASR